MNTNRQLDAETAERVMGIRVTKDDQGYWPPPRQGENFAKHEIQEYSSYIAKAFEVVDAMQMKGFNFTLVSTEKAVCARFSRDKKKAIITVDAQGEAPQTAFEAIADTFPLAICLAALKAVSSVDETSSVS